MKAAEGPNGLRRVRETKRPGAGTPLTRSRTWQVMGSLVLLVVVVVVVVDGGTREGVLILVSILLLIADLCEKSRERGKVVVIGKAR